MCALIRPCPLQLTWEACKNRFCCFFGPPTTYLNSHFSFFSFKDMNDSKKSIVNISHNCSCIHFAFPPALITFSEWFCTPLIISNNFAILCHLTPCLSYHIPTQKTTQLQPSNPLGASESLSLKNVWAFILKTIFMWRSFNLFPDKIFSFSFAQYCDCMTFHCEAVFWHSQKSYFHTHG